MLEIQRNTISFHCVSPGDADVGGRTCCDLTVCLIPQMTSFASLTILGFPKNQHIQHHPKSTTPSTLLLAFKTFQNPDLSARPVSTHTRSLPVSRTLSFPQKYYLQDRGCPCSLLTLLCRFRIFLPSPRFTTVSEKPSSRPLCNTILPGIVSIVRY